MSFCSPLFFLAMCGLAILHRGLGAGGGRRLLMTAANVGFLALFVPNRDTWLGFALFLGGTYALLEGERALRSRVFLAAAVTGVCAAFLVVKRYAFLGDWTAGGWTVELVGLSYMLFRFIHMLVDQAQGQLPRRDLVSYVNYQIGFATLVAGPLQRYEDFLAAWDAPGPILRSTDEDLRSWIRILGGMLKMGLAGPLLQALLGWYDAGGPWARLSGHFYLYPLFLYANFSGYTDVALGCGELLGQSLPENFNRPFLARNLLEFWNRWHMSLTRWIRDYVFTPAYKAVAERAPGGAQRLGYAVLFLALFVAGMWHGSTSGFVAFGLVHGLGAAWCQARGDASRARLGRAAHARRLKNPWLLVAARAATFHYVCFSFLFFSLGVEGTRRLWQDLPARLPRPALLLLPALALIGLAAADTLAPRLAAVRERMLGSRGGLWSRAILQSAAVALLFLGLWAFARTDPVVVYQRF